MNTNRIKIILAVMLAGILCAGALLLVGCGKEKQLKITDDYQIIRSDTAPAETKAQSGRIVEALKKLSVNPTVGTDWVYRDGSADFPEQEREILVGRTNRQESIDAYESLGTAEYLVRVSGQKIIVIGKDDYSLAKAVDYLLQNYLNEKNGAEVSAALDYRGTCEWMYTYRLNAGSGEKYDDCLTVAGLQGLFNREDEHAIYLTSSASTLPTEYRTLMSSEERWMSDIDFVELGSVKDVLTVAEPYIEKVVIWDTNVPATANVATTIAGVEDAVIMTKAQYDSYKNTFVYNLPVIDLVGEFDGKTTGSVKNDVYRWAIKEYLATGRCSLDYLCSFEDSYNMRNTGDIRYVVTRDWAVYHKAFVFDLSVWEDCLPKDDMKQKLGLDRETYELMLETVNDLRGPDQLTEIDGFFAANKYTKSGIVEGEPYTCPYDGTQMEWEYARVFTPYGCYWNPVAENSYNETVHMRAEVKEPLTQNRPETKALDDDGKKVYIMLVMGDYDASGSMYNKLIRNWNDSGRGGMPFAWSINPNLIRQYPDIISYFYETATENDYFVSNCGAAGWFTPSRVREDMWLTYALHCQHYFNMTDMSCAPDFWDFQCFDEDIEIYVGEFATTGFGTLVSNQLGRGTGKALEQHLSYDGIPVDPLFNPRNESRTSTESAVSELTRGINERKRTGHATFMAVRSVWMTPTYVENCILALENALPDYDIEVVDPYTYYTLFRESFAD